MNAWRRAALCSVEGGTSVGRTLLVHHGGRTGDSEAQQAFLSPAARTGSVLQMLPLAQGRRGGSPPFSHGDLLQVAEELPGGPSWKQSQLLCKIAGGVRSRTRPYPLRQPVSGRHSVKGERRQNSASFHLYALIVKCLDSFERCESRNEHCLGGCNICFYGVYGSINH